MHDEEMPRADLLGLTRDHRALPLDRGVLLGCPDRRGDREAAADPGGRGGERPAGGRAEEREGRARRERVNQHGAERRATHRRGDCRGRSAPATLPSARVAQRSTITGTKAHPPAATLTRARRDSPRTPTTTSCVPARTRVRAIAMRAGSVDHPRVSGVSSAVSVALVSRPTSRPSGPESSAAASVAPLRGLAGRDAGEGPRDGRQDDGALVLLPGRAHLRLDVERLLHRLGAPIQLQRRNRIAALAPGERRVVDPGHEPLRRELARPRAIRRAEVVGNEREREADREALRHLLRDAPEPDDDDELGLAGLVEGRRRGLTLDQRGDAGRPGLAARERAERAAERRIRPVAEGVVVVEERLVSLAALLEGEAGKVAAEAEERRLALVIAQVSLHDREAASLDPGPAEVALGQVVHHVDGVDEQLLVGGRLVRPHVVREEVFAEIVGGPAGHVEQVDRLVRGPEIARGQPVAVHAEEDVAAVEQEERVVAPERRELGRGLDLELLVQRGHRLGGSAAIERLERGANAIFMSAAGGLPEAEEQRERSQGRTLAPREARVPPAHHSWMSALVKAALFCQATALVATSMSCMNMKYWTRRSSSVRSSAVKTLPVR